MAVQRDFGSRTFESIRRIDSIKSRQYDPRVKRALSGNAWYFRLLFIILVPCLFLQIKLRDITEPYPAILLPGAGPLLESRGSFNAYRTKVVAEDSLGAEHPFLVATVLDTVPTNYHEHVSRGDSASMGIEM